jgi:hypothetical protein
MQIRMAAVAIPTAVTAGVFGTYGEVIFANMLILVVYARSLSDGIVVFLIFMLALL